MVSPSCPALVIHPNDAFRKALIAALDQHHFKVSFDSDEARARERLDTSAFRVIIVGLNVAQGLGVQVLDLVRGARERHACGVILLGDADPQLRTIAPWADETLLKPVDANYVAQRARTYCDRH